VFVFVSLTVLRRRLMTLGGALISHTRTYVGFSVSSSQILISIISTIVLQFLIVRQVHSILVV
jgi:hypothetical protein